uniref:Uncharacterized protein n=1 Tax=Oryzias latipes TaxID=8090 RepID=A0A3P9KD43_ORYLA
KRLKHPAAAPRAAPVLKGSLQRCLSTQTDGEVRIANKLREMFPSAASNAGPPNIHWHPRATDQLSFNSLLHILIKFCSHKCK